MVLRRERHLHVARGERLATLLNDTGEEALASDNKFATFNQPSQFMDPRRAMIGVRLNLGR
jgi:hypothetical protein